MHEDTKLRIIVAAVLFMIAWFVALYAAYGLCPEGQRRFCDKQDRCACYPYKQ